MNALVFEAIDGQLVKLSAATVRVLQGFRQTAPRASEAGGVLLGRWIDGVRNVVVDDPSALARIDPGVLARSGPSAGGAAEKFGVRELMRDDLGSA